MTRNVALLAVVSVVALAGCGRGLASKAVSSADINDLPPAERIVAAGTKTSNEGTFHARFDLAVTGLGPTEGPSDLNFGGEGAFDVANERSTVRFDMHDIPGVPADTGAAAESLEIVVDGSDVYMRVGSDIQKFLPGAKGWIRLSRDALGAVPGGFGGGMQMLGGTDPTEPLGALERLGGVTEAGRADVRGVPTTRYEGEIDLGAMSDNLFGAAQAAMLQDFGPIRYEVWIDDGGLLRRMSARMRMPSEQLLGAAEGGVKAEMVFSVELYDFGAPVTVEVPDRKDVSELTDLIGEAPPGF